MKKISNWVLTNIEYQLYNIGVDEFQQTKGFLDDCRNKLERIEFFYPYKDEELMEVLEKGRFLGLYDKEKLIATFGLDLDKGYAKQLANLITKCTNGRITPQLAYETSGLFVDEHYRGLGIASKLMKELLRIANEYDGYLCGVVQLENVASMQTFLSNGFVLAGIYSMGGEYDFGYFTKPIHSKIEYDKTDKVVPFRNVKDHLKMLSEGYVGTYLESFGIGYSILKK